MDQTTVPITRLQALNARTLQEALHETAQATLHTDADVGGLVAYRDARSNGDAVTAEAVVGRALVGALEAHPKLNARVGVEGLILHRAVNLGWMVTLDKGVVVPVIDRAEALSLRELDHALRRLTERAKTGDLNLNETRNATFTLSSFADFGVDHLTPILVGNMVATLAMGRIRSVCEPTASGCRPGHRMALSLTFDHRAIHGVEAARFLQTLTERLAAPDDLR